jgi:hypothetical protein
LEKRLPSALPDADTLASVLELAAWAPSLRNSQPWRWRVDNAGLHLEADWERGGGDAVIARRDVLLGCGAVLDHCGFGPTAAGWHPRIRRYPDGAVDGRLASFELIDRAAPAAALELVTAIPRRRSDRRDYATSPLPSAALELL